MQSKFRVSNSNWSEADTTCLNIVKKLIRRWKSWESHPEIKMKFINTQILLPNYFLFSTHCLNLNLNGTDAVYLYLWEDEVVRLSWGHVPFHIHRVGYPYPYDRFSMSIWWVQQLIPSCLCVSYTCMYRRRQKSWDTLEVPVRSSTPGRSYTEPCVSICWDRGFGTALNRGVQDFFLQHYLLRF